MVSVSYTVTHPAPPAQGKQSSLPLVTKVCYGVGHIYNDLCASMWFSYLLVFFERVLQFNQTKAGLILLVGQLADGFSTPVVGILSDKENKIEACANYGRRKIWHLMGTLFVTCSFAFIFSPCLGCSDAEDALQLAYYCAFVVLFQFGWACVQISHLSLIPELTPKKHSRTELNSIRYGFTVLSNLSVYTVAFLFLGIGSDDEIAPDNPVDNATSTTTVQVSTTTDGPSNSSISPADAPEFRNMALFCICAGTMFSAIFHFGVKEPAYKCPKKVAELAEKSQEKNKTGVVFTRMRKTDWFKEIAFYQVAALYMVTRLYVNLYQVYIPLYVQDTLFLGKTAIATVPFTMYLAGFCGSLIMKQVNKRIGRKGAYSLGCIIGLIGCVGVAFGHSEAYKTWGVYCVAALLGIGGSTVLITSLSITADLIADNVEGGAFVYGFMSLTDKISNGVVIMLIQNSYTSNPSFYQHIITYACGTSCLLGLLIACSLIPVKVGQRRGVSKKVAALVEDQCEGGGVQNVLTCTKPQIEEDKVSTVSKAELDNNYKENVN